eukprot:TRINITY_DN6857_c0_g1_i4.p1 TRINITY_DN6857_c0_g1~~TRINITY_DN6857_c0_g1_i4.p1  ORF type:complete len:340 (+),score=74.92 TRINITY_DN6857_c0_g1_i4:95-1114(+)
MCIRDRYQRRVRGVPFSMSSGLSPDPVAVEICRLRASHRYHDADMLAEKLRASVIESAGGQQTTEEAATPAPSAGAADDAKAADAEAPPEKKLTAKERIMALQDALTKVQFEGPQPTMSWNEPPQNHAQAEPNYLQESDSVEESARRVYEMAMAAVEQEEEGSPNANEQRVEQGSYVPLRSTRDYAPAGKQSPEPTGRGVVLAKQFLRDVQECMVVLTPQEQRRADSQQRIDELRSQLAARHSQLDPEQSGPVSEQEVATKHRLRAIADVHGLSKSASFIEQTTPKESGDQPAPVATMSSICPAVYSDSAQRRIMELRKAQHEMNLAPHHSMKWSDMDR